jgi:RNA-splicing ligase RtcB
MIHSGSRGLGHQVATGTPGALAVVTVCRLY